MDDRVAWLSVIANRRRGSPWRRSQRRLGTRDHRGTPLLQPHPELSHIPDCRARKTSTVSCSTQGSAKSLVSFSVDQTTDSQSARSGIRLGRWDSRIDFVRSEDARSGAEVSLNLQSRLVLENLRDRGALVCAQIGMNLLTVCLRRGSSCYSDQQFVMLENTTISNSYG